MQILFDRRWTDREEGVARRVVHPQKHPEPILQAEKPWEAGGSVQTTRSIFYDADRASWRMYYRAAPAGGSDDGHSLICLAESDDGLHWRRPELGLVAFEGSRANNIVLSRNNGDGFLMNVIRDGVDEDPARRYKAMGFCAGGDKSKGIHVAFSPDGLRWTPHPDNPVLATTVVTDCVLFHDYDPVRRRYQAFPRPRTYPKRRFVAFSESADFVRWQRPRIILTPDADDGPDDEFYGLVSHPAGEELVGALWIYHNDASQKMTNELVWATDPLHWNRFPGREAYLPLGHPGAPDCGMLMPVTFASAGDEVRIYCNAVDHGHGRGGEDNLRQLPPDGSPRCAAVTVATIPKDRFVELVATSDRALVETRFVSMGEGGLSVNADGSRGPIRVEVLNQFYEVVPGFSAGECDPITTDGTDIHVTWQRGRRTAAREARSPQDTHRIGNVVKIRFHMEKGARLFAYNAGLDPVLETDARHGEPLASGRGQADP